jgi:hypothetical protein
MTATPSENESKTGGKGKKWSGNGMGEENRCTT